MKRVITLIMTLALVATMSLSVLAAGDFVGSPTGRPELTYEYKALNAEDEAFEVIIEPYGNRDELPDWLREILEDAYDVIATGKLPEVLPGYDAIADENGVKADGLGVTDLFGLYFSKSTVAKAAADEQPTGKFEVTVTAESLHDFAALGFYNGTEWSVIDDAKVVDGKLVFTAEEAGAYSIIVKTAADVEDPEDPEDPGNNDPTGPQTGDYVEYVAYVAAASAVVIALIVVISKVRKPAEDNK